MVKYFRTMTTANLIEYKKLNTIFKRKLKEERIKLWKTWAEKLGPNTPVKEIFKSFKRLSGYRTPNQPNIAFQDSEMVEKFLAKLCKRDAPTTVEIDNSSMTEDSFSTKELDFVVKSKVDTALGVDGMKYSDLDNFPDHVKTKFLQLVNDVWASQNITGCLKKILMALIPKSRTDSSSLGVPESDQCHGEEQT